GPYYPTMMVNLMVPIRHVQAVATSGQEERLITSEGRKQGTTFKVGTPTSVLSLLEFDGVVGMAEDVPGGAEGDCGA
ncbi:hypothetical protein ACC705_35740, partial [Rhizobium ruizarguesonis]